jgi:hypothetical protein
MEIMITLYFWLAFLSIGIIGEVTKDEPKQPQKQEREK